MKKLTYWLQLKFPVIESLLFQKLQRIISLNKVLETGETITNTLLHASRDCEQIDWNGHCHPVNPSDADSGEPTSIKVGRGAWVTASTENRCPHCFKKEIANALEHETQKKV